MDALLKNPHVLKQQLFEKWLNFFIFVNNEHQNYWLLTHYFFERFAQSPEIFYKFILFFKKNLLSRQNKKIVKRLALKYLCVLSSLCERFSLFEQKNSLDDVCFKLLYPRQYKNIQTILVSYKKRSKRIITAISKRLRDFLHNKGYQGDLKGRYKNLYSIYRKTLQKKKTVLNLNDIFAFRIILKKNSIKQCFEILNLLHDTYYPIPDFFKDYITIPKINGYQSLHTGLGNVIPDLDLQIEIQIRTSSMDDFAERGFAAHWRYSHDKQSKLLTEKEKRLLNYFNNLSQISMDENFVYFFSYQGDFFRLKKRASIHDFARNIHSHLPERAKGALVNGKMVSLDTTIQEGDIIKILM